MSTDAQVNLFSTVSLFLTVYKLFCNNFLYPRASLFLRIMFLFIKYALKANPGGIFPSDKVHKGKSGHKCGFPQWIHVKKFSILLP